VVKIIKRRELLAMQFTLFLSNAPSLKTPIALPGRATTTGHLKLTPNYVAKAESLMPTELFLLFPIPSQEIFLLSSACYP
jgi:hypothetical protein